MSGPAQKARFVFCVMTSPSRTICVCVPAHLQSCRALMILSLLLGLASILVSVLGLRCTKLGGTPERVKDQMVLSGGVLFILSGTSSGTRTSTKRFDLIKENFR